MEKGQRHILPDELAKKSYALGALAFNSGFRPQFMIALWRGGATIGCYVHELFKWANVPVDHIAIRTSRQDDGSVVVHNVNYISKQLQRGSKVLIVDDVFDSGKSISALIQKLTKESMIPCDKMDIRIATIFYKPKRNLSFRKPDFYVEETDDWLVFPHEVEGMTLAQIGQAKGGEIESIFEKVQK